MTTAPIKWMVRGLCLTLLLAAGRVAVGDEVSVPAGVSASAFHAPETLRLNNS